MERTPSRRTVSVLEQFLREPDRWLHGYDLMQDLQIASGSLYPILMRLHDRGVLDARWEDSTSPGRPRRRMYRLTKDGREWAQSVVSAGSRGSALRPGFGTA